MKKNIFSDKLKHVVEPNKFDALFQNIQEF